MESVTYEIFLFPVSEKDIINGNSKNQGNCIQQKAVCINPHIILYNLPANGRGHMKKEVF